MMLMIKTMHFFAGVHVSMAVCGYVRLRKTFNDGFECMQVNTKAH